MKIISSTIAAGLALWSGTAGAVDYLSAKCEVALALSALPEDMRINASAYVLTRDGFKLGKEGSGPFTCIVQRNHPQAVIPQCLDAKGTEVILPAIMHKAEMALSGATPAEVEADFKKRADAGEFRAPDGIGVNYMMSHYNYIYVAGAGRILRIPPHLMHYAPNVTNAELGIERSPGMPFVNEAGPHGYFISFVEDPADPDDVAEACAGEVGQNPPRIG